MIIKDKFDLLKGVPNVLTLSQAKINSVSIDKGPAKIYTTLKLIEDRIKHYTKKTVFREIDSIKKNKKVVALVSMSDYILPVSVNKSNKQIIINLDYFGADDISRVDPKNIYACMVYGICMRELISGKAKVPDSFSSVVASFLLTVHMKLFGKEFGLLGVYSTQIPKLKFLISCYVLVSMFGMTQNLAMFKKASNMSQVDLKNFNDDYTKYDFTNINTFIKTLSSSKLMPGITRHTFAAKFIRILSLNFLPGLEDVSRFISIITTSNFPGTSVAPTFIEKYNRHEYERILKISEKVFK